MEIFEEKNSAEGSVPAKTEATSAEDRAVTSEPVRRYEGKSYIFSDLSSQKDMMGVLCRNFGVDPEGQGDTLVLKNEDIEIRVAVVGSSAGEKAEEFIKGQTEAVCQHFLKVETKAVDVKTNLLYQIGRANGLARIEYSFDVEDPEDLQDKKAAVEGMFIAPLNELEGIILISDEESGEDSIFCCGENQERLLILSEKGGSSFSRYLPYQEPELKGRKDLSKEQVERRMRSLDVLAENGIYVPAWYPAVEASANITCPSLEEMSRRAIALMGVCIYSECMHGDKPDFEGGQNFLMDFIDNYNSQDYFSPREWKFIHDTAPDKKEANAFTWQYESLYVMAWALGLVEELEFPDHTCDVPLVVNALRKCDSISKLLAKSKPRSPRELLDACDLTSCLHWACVSVRRHGLSEPAGMNTGVVIERHKALNWLTGFGNGASWDEVKADI